MWESLEFMSHLGSLPGIAAAALSSTLLLLLILLINFSFNHKSKLLPPSPPALPLLGHIHLLGSNPTHSLSRLALRYGPLMSLKLGSIPFIVASSPEAARQILQTHDQTFAFRMRLASADAIYGACPSIGFTDLGPYWKFLRQLCATDLFSSRRLMSFKPIRDEEVSALLRSILEESSGSENSNSKARYGQNPLQKLVDLRPKLQAATNNIISRMAVGQTEHAVLAPVLEAMEALSHMNMGDFLPWIQWADLQGCVKRSKKAAIKMHAAFQEMIEHRRTQRAGVYDPPAHILDILLSVSLTCPQDLQITDAHIRTTLFDIFAGATDTSSVVLEWTMAELLGNPTKMRILEEEIQRVVSEKEANADMVEELDIQKLPYLRAVVKESMRLHPVLPMLVPRESRKACQILGFEIPAKTQAFVNTWAIGRDPKLWENPHDFQPERFLEKNIDVRGQHFELLPFGSGRRVCPGQNLGLLNVHIILASLIHAFSWSLDEHELDMSEKFAFVTTKAKPLLARAVPKTTFTIF